MSYATPDLFQTRVSPRIAAQLSAETPSAAADEQVIQGWLNAASSMINIRIGSRFVVPVTAPPSAIDLLAGLELDIALFLGWVYRGVNENENPGRLGMQNALDILKSIETGAVDALSGAILIGSASIDAGNWYSEEPHFDPPDTWTEPIT